MVLVEYSDSEDDASEDDETPNLNGNSANPLKRKRKEHDQVHYYKKPTLNSQPLPPLPSTLHSLYATNVRSGTIDDPTLHGGRTRQIPHVEGNWPTHVFLEWMPSKSQLSILDQIIERARSNCSDADGSVLHSFLRSDLGAQLPLHVSLSAPLVLTTERKDEFRDDLVKALKAVHLNEFVVSPESVRWVSNHDVSRYFLVVGLQRPEDDQLNLLLKACNSVARAYGLTELYQRKDAVGVSRGVTNIDSDDLEEEQEKDDRSAAFHISIAWSLQAPSLNTEKAGLPVLSFLKELDNIVFDSVRIKIGNVIHPVSFSRV